jgi:CubicO group peptidase (beta-lactamase class C family)
MMISSQLYQCFGDNKFINSLLSEACVNENINAIENGLLPAISIEGTTVSKMNLAAQMILYDIPAVSLAVINDGEIEWAKSYGKLINKTDREACLSSLFQAGSISKPVSAFGALALVQKGVLDLNENVNLKLNSWKIQENQHTASEKVALKHLLSHTSGVSVMSFSGYDDSKNIPNLIEILSGKGQASNPELCIEFEPGKESKYSSGAYMVMQQLIEDAAVDVFSNYMDKAVFKPLDMSNSTMSCPLLSPYADNIATGHTE